MPLKVFLSRRPERYGGGSNTFVTNFHAYARRLGVRIVQRIEDADMAIVIANRGISPEELEKAAVNGCFVVHRIDEHFGAFSDPARLAKHKKIKELNRYASVTVYQSEFVCENAQAFLGAENYCVIHNGGNQYLFHPRGRPGTEIGHITWSLLEKKGLRVAHEEIAKRPEEKFRLVGVHRNAVNVGLDFNLPNVVLRGERPNACMPREFRRMKALFFPSRDDPCPNTVIEAILCGVPVCYHESGGTPELVKDCGEPLSKLDRLLDNLEFYRTRCMNRIDLHFDNVFKQYVALYPGFSVTQ